MKSAPVAIAIQAGDSAGLAALVDPRFGRAAAFVITDLDGTTVTVVENDHVDAPHGAGTGAAGLLIQHGVGAVIANQFGPKALQALQAAAVSLWIAPAGITAAEALRRYNEGELQPMVMSEFR